jgi:hypothetical protein
MQMRECKGQWPSITEQAVRPTIFPKADLFWPFTQDEKEMNC